MSKLSGYAPLGATPATNDMIPVRDVSDTSMAASGTTKEVSFANVIAGLSKADGSVPMTAALQLGTVGQVTSAVADGASAVGVDFNTSNTMATAGAKLFRVRNNGTEKFSVNKDGGVVMGSATSSGVRINPMTSHGTYASPVLSAETGDASALAAVRSLRVSTQQGYFFNDDLGAGDKLWYSSGQILAINAAQSAYVPLRGKLTTDTNAVAETPTASHTLTMYDGAGTAYKVLAVPA